MVRKIGKYFRPRFNMVVLSLSLMGLLSSGSSLSCSRKSGCPAVDTINSRLSNGKEMPKSKRSKSGGLFPKGFKR